MGTACGRASVLGSALIHTKTGAHREDVAQHAGDRFGSPITRRPDAAALSDGADSPPVSIPVLRMPPRKPQMTKRTGESGPIVSICNSCGAKPGLHVTDRDIQSAPWLTSQSVTTRPHIPRQMLQIETDVPSTRPDRQQKDRTSSHHNWNVRPRQTSTREAKPTPRSLYSASGSLKFLGSKTMQV